MPLRLHLTCVLIAFSTLAASRCTAATVNGFANGSFELVGTTTPAEAWQTAASGYTLSSDARTGSFSAQLSSPELNAAVALQNSTDHGLLPPLTPGDTPSFSFWSKGFAGTTGNALFSLRYLNADGAIVYNSGNQFFHTLINESTWTEVTFTPDAVPIGAESAFIEFSQAIGPINNNDLLPGSVLIDDVRLSVVTAIPEPTSAAVLCLGGVVLLCRRRR